MNLFFKRKKGIDWERIKSIADLRTGDYRVFYAAPYFSINLYREIDWHERHLKKLRKFERQPHLFHKQYTDDAITLDHKRYFREHVLDSIPFHQQILDEHKIKLKAILTMMPRGKYVALADMTLQHGGLPEFFVYDKRARMFFFVVEHLTEEKKRWIYMVKGRHNLCDVLLLD